MTIFKLPKMKQKTLLFKDLFVHVDKALGKESALVLIHFYINLNTINLYKNVKPFKETESVNQPFSELLQCLAHAVTSQKLAG